MERARALFSLMQVHRLNLPKLDEYVNAKDQNGMPLYPDVDQVILPHPTERISRTRLHQILQKVPEYLAQSSWKSTREKAKNMAIN